MLTDVVLSPCFSTIFLCLLICSNDYQLVCKKDWVSFLLCVPGWVNIKVLLRLTQRASSTFLSISTLQEKILNSITATTSKQSHVIINLGSRDFNMFSSNLDINYSNILEKVKKLLNYSKITIILYRIWKWEKRKNLKNSTNQSKEKKENRDGNWDLRKEQVKQGKREKRK